MSLSNPNAPISKVVLAQAALQLQESLFNLADRYRPALDTAERERFTTYLQRTLDAVPDKEKLH